MNWMPKCSCMNPIIQETVVATRRRIKVDMELPLKDDYSVFIKDLVMREHPDEKQQNFEAHRQNISMVSRAIICRHDGSGGLGEYRFAQLPKNSN
jgi:hypothetical protein